MNVKHQKVEDGREARGGIDLKRLAKISCLGKIPFHRQHLALMSRRIFSALKFRDHLGWLPGQQPLKFRGQGLE